MLRLSSAGLLLLLQSTCCLRPVPGVLRVVSRGSGSRHLPLLAVAPIADDAEDNLDLDFGDLLDDVVDDDEEEFEMWEESAASAPRGFGFGGASLDAVQPWIVEMDAEDAADGVTMAAELKAKRNKILLRWADFVQSAGGGDQATEPVAALRDVSLSFDGEPILQGVSWEVCEEQVVGIVGESGCGKSTQMRLLAGEATPDSGEVWFAESTASEERDDEALEGVVRPGVLHVPQDVLATLAAEETPLAEYVTRTVGAEAADEVWAWIGWVPGEEEEEEEEEEDLDNLDLEIEDEIEDEDDEELLAQVAAGNAFFGSGAPERPVRALSSGQQVRLAVALALARPTTSTTTG